MAFGSTVEREQAFPPERWKERTRQGSVDERWATFIAEEANGTLVGMVTVGAPKEATSFNIFGMWVRPSHRGRGLGGRLLDAALEFAERASPGATVELEVVRTQEAAVRTYESRGFRFTGATEPLGHSAPAVCHLMIRPGR